MSQLSQIASFRDFCIFIFAVCDVRICTPITIWSKFLWMKRLQMATDPRKLQKFIVDNISMCVCVRACVCARVCIPSLE